MGIFDPGFIQHFLGASVADDEGDIQLAQFIADFRLGLLLNPDHFHTHMRQGADHAQADMPHAQHNHMIAIRRSHGFLPRAAPFPSVEEQSHKVRRAAPDDEQADQRHQIPE